MSRPFQPNFFLCSMINFHYIIFNMIFVFLNVKFYKKSLPSYSSVKITPRYDFRDKKHTLIYGIYHKNCTLFPRSLPCRVRSQWRQCDRQNPAECFQASDPGRWSLRSGGDWEPGPARPDRTWRPPRWTSPPWRAGWRGPHLSRSPRSGRACPQSVKLIIITFKLDFCII